MTKRTVETLRDGVLAGDRAMLGQAITLIESVHPERHAEAQALLRQLLPMSGKAVRIGLTGTPGVGKSTLIESLGTRLADEGRQVAVLSIDPSSTVSGGSILGDKARMHRLAQHKNAYIRPSPTATTLGGVALRTHEALVVCEAAGFDTIFVETVGVGQSEVMVADLVDTMILMLLPGGGDELQGIKRGVLERADVVVIHKADGPQRSLAKHSADEVRAALRYARETSNDAWSPVVLEASSVSGEGLDELWTQVNAHRAWLSGGNRLASRRTAQLGTWIRRSLEEELLRRLHNTDGLAKAIKQATYDVSRGARTASEAAAFVLESLPDLR